MSSVEELLSVKGHYFSTTVTRRLSVNDSLAVRCKVNVLFYSSVVVSGLSVLFVLDLIIKYGHLSTYKYFL